MPARLLPGGGGSLEVRGRRAWSRPVLVLAGCVCAGRGPPATAHLDWNTHGNHQTGNGSARTAPLPSINGLLRTQAGRRACMHAHTHPHTYRRTDTGPQHHYQQHIYTHSLSLALICTASMSVTAHSKFVSRFFSQLSLSDRS